MGNIVTGKVRFSYTNVFEARQTPNGDLKYSVTLLIPKSDTTTYQKIINEINKTLEEATAKTFGGVKPANPRMPIYDGDGVRASGEAFGTECKGCWVMTANSISAPEVVDASLQPILSKNDFYSGCYGRAGIRFYAYNQNGNKGIGCGLGNVQKLEDGQPLDGRTKAVDDFGTAPEPVAQYQNPIQQQAMQPATPGYQVDPITGQPVVPTNNFVAPQQPTVNNIYGVN